MSLFVQRGAAVAPGSRCTEDECRPDRGGLRAARRPPPRHRAGRVPGEVHLTGRYARRLDHRLAVLMGGGRTCRPATGPSGDDPVELRPAGPTGQRLFARSRRPRGGPDAPAAEAVADPDGELGVDTLDSIGDASGQQPGQDRAGPGEVRFDMLETIREFATEALAGTGDEESLRRHLAYFRALADGRRPSLPIGTRDGSTPPIFVVFFFGGVFKRLNAQGASTGDGFRLRARHLPNAGGYPGDDEAGRL